jgi:hypothetical protein
MDLTGIAKYRNFYNLLATNHLSHNLPLTARMVTYIVKWLPNAPNFTSVIAAQMTGQIV